VGIPAKLNGPFLETPRRARIDVHQLAVQTVESALGVGVIHHRVGILQFSFDIAFVFLGKVIDHIAFLVNLASLDEGSLTRMPANRCVQR
jgi:hypothetical protein